MATVNLNHKRYNPESIEITLASGEYKKFASGDFVLDWGLATKYLVDKVSQTDEDVAFQFDVIDFACRQNAFEMMYLLSDENDNPVLLKGSSGGCALHMDEEMFVFVESGTQPTWKEYSKIIEKKYNERYNKNN